MQLTLRYILLSVLFLCFQLTAQVNTFSPYSRYGLGEITQPVLAHNIGMGGAFIASKNDSFAINTGNAAAYAQIRYTKLEVGGNYFYNNIQNTTTSLTKWGTNFGYAALGVPIRRNGGAVLGIMPYSNVGYDLKSLVTNPSIGEINYSFKGSGGLNKAFLGYGISPFKNSVSKLNSKYTKFPDSIHTYSHIKRRLVFRKFLSELSLGANLNYVFGSLNNVTEAAYPNSITFRNLKRERSIVLGDFTGNFGLQGGITFDSIKQKVGGQRRDLIENVTVTFGYFSSINNQLSALYDTKVVNYIVDGGGNQIIRDTVFVENDQRGKISLPIENGFGIGIRKGTRINALLDFGVTNWSNFNLIDTKTNYKNSLRISGGVEYCIDRESTKYLEKIKYRTGFTYNSGFIDLNGTTIKNYVASVGLGLPVGIKVNKKRGDMNFVNLAFQYGTYGTTKNNLIKEGYWRIYAGFTFGEIWFQKFKYD